MRKLLVIMALALVVPNMGFALGEGRYQMIKVDKLFVWVLDTKTGDLSLCRITQSFKPKCFEKTNTMVNENE